MHTCMCMHTYTRAHIHTDRQINMHLFIFMENISSVIQWLAQGMMNTFHYSVFFFSHYLQKQVTWKCATKLDRYMLDMLDIWFIFILYQHNHIMHTFVCFKWKRRKTEVQGRNEIPRNLRMLFQILKLVYYVALGIFINFLISLHDSSNIKWNQILDTC